MKDRSGAAEYRIFFSILCAFAYTTVLGQQFPAKTIRILAGTAAGGVTDVICRAYAQAISQSVGQPVVVENRPGNGAIPAAMEVLRAAPDGYTVAIATSEPLVYNSLLYTKLPYDPDKDFIPVAQLSRADGVIIAGASLPANTFPEVIAYAKANPSKLNFATIGDTSTAALYLKWINRQNSTSIEGIAYKGAAPTITALMSGEVHLTYQSVGFVLQNIKAGKLKAIAFTGTKPSPLLPGIATLAQFNSDPELESNFGAFARHSTPPEVIQRLNAEFVKATQTQAVRNMFDSLVFEAVVGTAGQFAEKIKATRLTAGRVFKALDIRPGALTD